MCWKFYLNFQTSIDEGRAFAWDYASQSITKAEQERFCHVHFKLVPILHKSQEYAWSKKTLF